MKGLRGPAVLLLALLAPASSSALDCSIDHRPAATLLLPYFEVDPSDPSGMTTLFSVNNSGAAAVLANVELWTDLGVPTLTFQVYLTGYDVQTINLRDIFNGFLPRTAPAGRTRTTRSARTASPRRIPRSRAAKGSRTRPRRRRC